MPIRFALLLLLISMQSFVLAHELDRGVTHNGSVCAACSIGGTHDAAVTVSHVCTVVVQNCPPCPGAAPAAAAVPFRLSPEPRAPPASH